jgi:hypothetical protein
MGNQQQQQQHLTRQATQLPYDALKKKEENALGNIRECIWYSNPPDPSNNNRSYSHCVRLAREHPIAFIIPPSGNRNQSTLVGALAACMVLTTTIGLPFGFFIGIIGFASLPIFGYIVAGFAAAGFGIPLIVIGVMAIIYLGYRFRAKRALKKECLTLPDQLLAAPGSTKGINQLLSGTQENTQPLGAKNTTQILLATLKAFKQNNPKLYAQCLKKPEWAAAKSLLEDATPLANATDDQNTARLALLNKIQAFAKRHPILPLALATPKDITPLTLTNPGHRPNPEQMLMMPCKTTSGDLVTCFFRIADATFTVPVAGTDNNHKSRVISQPFYYDAHFNQVGPGSFDLWCDDLGKDPIITYRRPISDNQEAPLPMTFTWDDASVTLDNNTTEADVLAYHKRNRDMVFAINDDDMPRLNVIQAIPNETQRNNCREELQKAYPDIKFNPLENNRYCAEMEVRTTEEDIQEDGKSNILMIEHINDTKEDMQILAQFNVRHFDTTKLTADQRTKAKDMICKALPNHSFTINEGTNEVLHITTKDGRDITDDAEYNAGSTRSSSSSSSPGTG